MQVKDSNRVQGSPGNSGGLRPGSNFNNAQRKTATTLMHSRQFMLNENENIIFFVKLR